MQVNWGKLAFTVRTPKNVLDSVMQLITDKSNRWQQVRIGLAVLWRMCHLFEVYIFVLIAVSCKWEDGEARPMCTMNGWCFPSDLTACLSLSSVLLCCICHEIYPVKMRLTHPPHNVHAWYVSLRNGFWTWSYPLSQSSEDLIILFIGETHIFTTEDKITTASVTTPTAAPRQGIKRFPEKHKWDKKRYFW